MEGSLLISALTWWLSNNSNTHWTVTMCQVDPKTITCINPLNFQHNSLRIFVIPILQIGKLRHGKINILA